MVPFRRASSGGVILIAPPWPYCGSANIFAAQTAAHAQAGRKVLLLLGPTDPAHCAAQSDFWSHALTGLAFPGASAVAHVPNFDAATGPNARSLRQWRAAGEDTALAVKARYASSGHMPAEVTDFLREHPLTAVHVNHCFEMRLGLRVANLAERLQGKRPPILLDSHDVQAVAAHGGFNRNPHGGWPDELAALRTAEADLCGGADVLIHCAPDDLAYFQSQLPQARHTLLPPSLDPRIERRLIADRGSQARETIDFLYVGNGNWPNFQSIEWFLDEVAPRLGDDARIAIVGGVGPLVRQHRPDLGARFDAILIGEVDEIADFYLGARAIIAPAVAGTGTSIKLIEGLCAGRPIIATRHALRGLPSDAKAESFLKIADDPQAFAAAMRRLPAEASGVGARGAAFYDRTFSSKRYAKRLNAVMRETVSLARKRPNATAPRPVISRPETLRIDLAHAAIPLIFKEGWHATEPFGRWTSAEQSEALLVLPAPMGGPLTIALELARPASAAIRLHVNGEDAGIATMAPGADRATWRLESRGDRLLSLQLAYDAIARPGPPHDADSRRLGLAVAAIDVEGEGLSLAPPQPVRSALMCKSFAPDLARFDVLVRSILAHNQDDLPLMVCAPHQDIPAFRQVLPGGTTLIAEEEFVEPRCYTWLDGWRQQQVAKLSFHKLGLCEQYLIVDSDSYFVRPFRTEDIFGPAGQTRVVVDTASFDHGYGALTADHDLALGVRPRPVFAAPEVGFRPGPLRLPECFLHDQNYKNCPPDLAWSVIPFAFSADYPRRRLTSMPSPMLFCADILAAFEAVIDADGLTFVDLIHLSPWEADWYSHFALKYFASRIRPITPMFVHFTTDAQLAAARRAGVTDETVARNFLGVNLAARHQNDLRL